MVNFTETHQNLLKDLIFEAVTKNWLVRGKLGQNFNVMDLFNATSIETLRTIKKMLTNKINELPEDEWTEKSQIAEEQSEFLSNALNLVNLTIGFRLHRAEQRIQEERKLALQARIAEIKESTKTPEEKLKELENELNSL